MTPNQEQLIYWIVERESIRNLKEQGIAPPWSSNPVMNVTYFCNVDREDDKVTRWIRQNWQYTDGHKESFDLAMVAARLFNLPGTLSEIMQPWDDYIDLWFENMAEVIASRKERKLNVWNGAYIVSTNGQKIPKGEYCINILKTIATVLPLDYSKPTLGDAHKGLVKLNGLGSFLAAQVIADLKNSNGHPLSSAEDWQTFSAHGPGSLRGLSWFWEEKVTPKNYQQKIQDARELLEWELPDVILDKLCMQNLQNCFCEYDKFMRVTTGTGRSKRKYIAK